MQRKFIHIFTVTLLSICLIETNSYAQEAGEDDLPIKPESSVVEKDSINTNTEEGAVEEPKSDMLTPVVITPKGRSYLIPDGETNSQKPTKKLNPSTNGEKAKQEEGSQSLKFNLLYYLFYKVKVGTSGTSN